MTSESHHPSFSPMAPKDSIFIYLSLLNSLKTGLGLTDETANSVIPKPASKSLPSPALLCLPKAVFPCHPPLPREATFSSSKLFYVLPGDWTQLYISLILHQIFAIN